MSARKDIEGKKFGRLLVLSFEKQKNTHAVWNVKCDCDKIFQTTYSNLSTGNTTACTSCGQTTHGFTGTSFWKRWQTMKVNHKDNISKEWNDFINFKNDTYDTFKKEYSLRRINNSKPYSKENCYWSIPSKKRTDKNKRILFT